MKQDNFSQDQQDSTDGTLSGETQITIHLDNHTLAWFRRQENIADGNSHSIRQALQEYVLCHSNLSEDEENLSKDEQKAAVYRVLLNIIAPVKKPIFKELTLLKIIELIRQALLSFIKYLFFSTKLRIWTWILFGVSSILSWLLLTINKIFFFGRYISFIASNAHTYSWHYIAF